MLNELMVSDNIADVPFNYWGAIKYNKLDLDKVPIKVYDPIYVRPSAISEVRRFKPKRKSSFGKDVFYEIIKGEKEECIIAYDDNVREDRLFSCVPQKESLDDFLAVTSINKFPIGFRCVDEETYETLNKNPPIEGAYLFMPSLVTFVVRDFEINDEFQLIEKTPKKDISALLKSMIASIRSYVKMALDNEVESIYVYSFINQGLGVGASQKRLHSQTLIDLTETGSDCIYPNFITIFKKQCPVCTLSKDYLIYENDHFYLWVSKAPLRNYSLRFAPKEHISRLEELPSSYIDSLSDILKVGNYMLSHLGVVKDRNIIFNSLHYPSKDNFHFFGEIHPFEPVGAFGFSGRYSVLQVSSLKAAKEMKSIKIEIEDYKRL